MTEVNNWRTLPNTLDCIGGHHVSIVGYSAEKAKEHIGEHGNLILVERIQLLLYRWLGNQR